MGYYLFNKIAITRVFISLKLEIILNNLSKESIYYCYLLDIGTIPFIMILSIEILIIVSINSTKSFVINSGDIICFRSLKYENSSIFRGIVINLQSIHKHILIPRILLSSILLRVLTSILD